MWNVLIIIYDTFKWAIKNPGKAWIAMASIARAFEDLWSLILNRLEGLWEFKLSHDEGYTREEDVIQSALHREGTVTSKYGVRKYNGHDFHYGVDIAANFGEPVYPIFDGTVYSVRNNLNDLGGRNVFVVSEDGQYRMMVCHLSKVNVKPGDHVTTNTVIGNVGCSGDGQEYKYPAHLHLEVHRRNSMGGFTSINPVDYGQKPMIDLSKYAEDVPDFELAQLRIPETTEETHPELTTGTTEADVNDNIYNTSVILMRELELSISQVSGIIGNIMHESRFNYHAANPNGSAEGLCQWLGDRKKNYHKRYGKTPKNDPNINNQIDFIVYELKSYESKALRKIKECHTPESAAQACMVWYERPGDSTGPSRQKYAREAYTIIMNRCIVKTNTRYVDPNEKKDYKHSYNFNEWQVYPR